MDQNQVNTVLQSPEFKELVSRRLAVSLTLSVIVLLVYFGFILLLAFDKAVLTHKIGEHVTVGIPVGVGIILLSWLATGVYIRWANSYYDTTVARIRSRSAGQLSPDGAPIPPAPATPV